MEEAFDGAHHRLGSPRPFRQTRALAQKYEHDATACWLHAVVHRMECDLGNARHRYGRCDRWLREEVTTEAELREIRATLA